MRLNESKIFNWLTFLTLAYFFAVSQYNCLSANYKFIVFSLCLLLIWRLYQKHLKRTAYNSIVEIVRQKDLWVLARLDKKRFACKLIKHECFDFGFFQIIRFQRFRQKRKFTLVLARDGTALINYNYLLLCWKLS